jgi:hypothetical protein
VDRDGNIGGDEDVEMKVATELDRDLGPLSSQSQQRRHPKVGVEFSTDGT